MSARDLVVQQGALTEIESALTAATTDLTSHLTSLLSTVDTTMAGWTDETPSRIAQRAYEQRLRDGITRLSAALDDVTSAVATHRELARETEVQNVAIIG